ncbi:MAG: VOC family protein [Armatimonadetes bacterium]|nr:VOC family protein [Armatimonadota bacterium]
MSSVKPIPDEYTGITPHLVVDGAADAIDFYKKAFGAEEISRNPAPDGKKLMHAAINVAGSTVYLCDDFPEWGPVRSPTALGGTSVTIHQYVEDADAAVARAEAAGAIVKMPVQETFWGDRYGTVADPFGHERSFATHVRDMTPEEMEKAAAEFFGR